MEIVYERGGKEQKDERDRLFEMLEVATIFYASRLDDDAKKYLRERGMSDATTQLFRLGLAGDSWSELSDFLKGKKFSQKEIGWRPCQKKSVARLSTSSAIRIFPDSAIALRSGSSAFGSHLRAPTLRRQILTLVGNVLIP